MRIYELDKDGQLHFVAQYDRFRSKIQSALVFGERGVPDGGASSAPDEDEPAVMRPEETQRQEAEEAPGLHLPPQILILLLQNGDVMFLGFTSCSKLQWAASMYFMKHNFLGDGRFHIAIDPSMQYLAISSRNGCVLCTMKPYSLVRTEFATSQAFDPITHVQAGAFRAPGGILRMEFLRPASKHKNFFVLLFVYRNSNRGGQTFLIAVDWMAGETDIFSRQPQTFNVGKDLSFPLMLIPLKFDLTFLLVTQTEIHLVSELLSWAPKVLELNCGVPDTSKPAYWAQWARPFRMKANKQEHLYLVRDDGALAHINIGIEDPSPSSVYLGTLGVNVDLAFATLDDPHKDILVVSGDCGPGGVWEVDARSAIKKINNVGNWSPVLDAAVTKGNIKQDDLHQVNRRAPFENDVGASSRLFSASGRGKASTITEWRVGKPAQIVFEMDMCEPIEQAWVVDNDCLHSSSGFCVISTSPSHTNVLGVSPKGELDHIPATASPLIMDSPTVHVAQQNSKTVIQVTENTVVLANEISR